MNFWVIQVLNGLSYGMVLFLLSSGLSVIFGLMRFINLAHGSFYLLGAYIGLTIINATNNFWLAFIAAPLAVGLLSIALQRWLLRRVRKNELAQVLLTFGVLLIVSDLSLTIWGGLPQTLPKPAFLEGSMRIGTMVFPSYRLALIGAGVAVAVLIWLFLERTRLGAIVRAGVDDEGMVRAIGIDISNVFTGVFAVGATLAALAGLLGGAMLGIYPGADFNAMLLAFAVVVIGGIGSLFGAFIGSLLVALIDTFGKALLPEYALFTVFVPMVIMLAFRPTGLFGRT
jgi:branched-chain amino acid transport system permease protein